MSLIRDMVAISIAHDSVQHYRTKHVKIDRYFIKNRLKLGSICKPFVQTKHQLTLYPICKLRIVLVETTFHILWTSWKC